MSALGRIFGGAVDDSGDIPRRAIAPAYTPPKNSITTATTGPQVRRGQPSQGGFQVLGVRPNKTGGGAVVPPISGPRVPPATSQTPSDKSGAGPGTDATRGLLSKRGGAGRTLLS